MIEDYTIAGEELPEFVHPAMIESFPLDAESVIEDYYQKFADFTGIEDFCTAKKAEDELKELINKWNEEHAQTYYAVNESMKIIIKEQE